MNPLFTDYGVEEVKIAVQHFQDTLNKARPNSVQDCPFPSRNPMEENKKGQKGKTSERWFHNNTEGCNNYQSGKCVFPGCKRAHVCHQCRGPDPFYKCATCGGKALP